LAHIVGYGIEIYYDARLYERQISNTYFRVSCYKYFLKVDTGSPWLAQFQVTQFQPCAILEIGKIRNNIIVRHAEFFFPPCRNKIIVRRKWRKSTAGRWRRRREGHAAADKVTLCLCLDFYWTPLYSTYIVDLCTYIVDLCTYIVDRMYTRFANCS